MLTTINPNFKMHSAASVLNLTSELEPSMKQGLLEQAKDHEPV